MKAKRKNVQSVIQTSSGGDHFTEAYSANSSDHLAVDSVENFKLTDFTVSFGPWLGSLLFLYLRAQPIEERTKVLAVISSFRRGMKSVGIAGQTGAMMGMSGLATNLAKGLTAGVGIANGFFMIGYLLPNIAAKEKSFKQKIELNQLLTKHLEKYSLIPQKLSPEDLMTWLKAPDFSVGPLTPVTEADFQQLTEDELNEYAWLKAIEEVINGFYFTSVLNTNLDLVNSAYIMNQIATHLNKVNPIHWINLGINLAALMIFIPLLLEKGQHQAQGLALEVKQSYLTGKLSLIDNQLGQLPRSAAPSQPPAPTSAPAPVVVSVAQLQANRTATQQQIVQCQQEYKQNQERNFDKLDLAVAGMRGYQEGGETVELYTSIPLLILAVAHVVTVATCPPLFFALLGVTIAVSLYRMGQRLAEAKETIAEKKRENWKKDPATQQPACVMAPSVKSISQKVSGAFCSMFSKNSSRDDQHLQTIYSY